MGDWRQTDRRTDGQRRAAEVNKTTTVFGERITKVLQKTRLKALAVYALYMYISLMGYNTRAVRYERR